ncbi:hypothetical protein V8C86DRAFT_2466861 [Haematococcus lacustris]
MQHLVTRQVQGSLSYCASRCGRVWATRLAARRHRLSRSSGTVPCAKKQERDPGQYPTPTWQANAKQWWTGLSTSQKAFTLTAGLAVLVSVPRLLLLLLVGLERTLVGGLLQLEEAVVRALFSLSAVALAAGTLLLLGTGLFVFLVPGAKDKINPP